MNIIKTIMIMAIVIMLIIKIIKKDWNQNFVKNCYRDSYNKQGCWKI